MAGMISSDKLILRNINSLKDISFANTGDDDIVSLSTVISRNTTEAISEGTGCTHEDFNGFKGLNVLVISFGIFLIAENVLLITIIGRTRYLHTNTNILVASLAVTDVLNGVQCCTMGTAGFSVGIRPWLATLNSDLHIYDSLMLSLNLSLVVVSLLHVSCLAVDRYLYVLWPLRYQRRVTRARVLTTAAGIWTVGIVYTLLPLGIFSSPRYRQGCIFTELPVSFGYGPIGAIYLVCFIAVVYCTFALVRIARRHKLRRIKKRETHQVFKCRPEVEKKKAVFVVAYKCSQTNQMTQVTGKSNELHVGNNDDNTWKEDTFSSSRNVSAPVTINNPVQFTVGLSDDENVVDSKTSAISKSIIIESKNSALSLCKELGKSESSFYSASSPALANAVTLMESDISLSSKDTGSSVTCRSIDQAGLALKKTGVNDVPTSDLSNIVCYSSEKTDSKEVPTTANFKMVPELHKSEMVKNCSPTRRSGTSISEVKYNKKDESNRSINNANMKIIKFVVIVFGTFFACTFPAISLLSVTMVFNVPLFAGNEVAYDVIHFWLTLNSGMNFFTIIYMNKDFRRALSSTLSPCKIWF